MVSSATQTFPCPAHPAEFHVDPLRRVLPPPREELRHPLEPLAGLRELQHRVGGVHLVCQFLLAGGAAVEVPLQRGSHLRLVHAGNGPPPGPRREPLPPGAF